MIRHQAARLEAMNDLYLHWCLMIRHQAAGLWAMNDLYLCRGFIKLNVLRQGPKWHVLRPFLRDGMAVSLRTMAMLGMIMTSSSLLARVNTASQAAHEIMRQVWIFTFQVRSASSAWICSAMQYKVGLHVSGFQEQ
jgi:Na+-driven multidrug efflux pump